MSTLYKIYTINSKGEKVYHTKGKSTTNFGKTAKRKAKIWKKESTALKHLNECILQGITAFLEVIEIPYSGNKGWRQPSPELTAHQIAELRGTPGRDGHGRFLRKAS